jgi:hypothetical protein
LAICAKINLASTGASTINVNGYGAKAIVDSLGNPITNGGLKALTPYTLRYNGVNFILQGKGGGGNVTADKLLNGITATGDSGAVVGTMADNGAITLYPGAVAQNIPIGYHNGAGIVATDVNLVPGNIKAGATVFGVAGSSKVNDTTDGTATASQILTGATGYVNGSKVTGTMPSNGAVIITPSTVNQTIANGNHDGTGYVVGDSDLVTGNIKSGVNIFGVVGKASVVDTADGTTTADKILNTYTGYVNGAKVTGTMANNGAVTITPGATAKAIPVGYHNGSGTVATDVNLVTGNIISGKTIFGVAGKASVVETSSANATAGQMLSGVTGYVNGALITGNIASKTAQTYYPGTGTQTIGAGQYLSGVQTINGDGNLIASNILSGKTIFGVAGSAPNVQVVRGTTAVVAGTDAYITVSLPWVPDAMGAYLSTWGYPQLAISMNYDVISKAVGISSSGTYKSETMVSTTRMYIGNNAPSAGSIVTYVAVKWS